MVPQLGSTYNVSDDRGTYLHGYLDLASSQYNSTQNVRAKTEI